MSEPTDRDPPIEPQKYIGGVKVVDIGDIRVARGMSRRPYSACPHAKLVYDRQERRVWCEDCETNVEAFDAFESLVTRFDAAMEAVDRRNAQLAEVEKFQARTIAAKRLDEAWRRRRTVPACPHCHQGLFPEDFKEGCITLGREYAEELAGKKAKS